MCKTCYECKDIRQTFKRGRPRYYCGQIMDENDEYFFITRAGTIPRRCPILKKNKRRKEMKENNGEGQIDRDKLNKRKEPEKLDITAELIKLYRNDPISNRIIQYLLKKYKIIPLNAVESIRLHREEILLNIVNVYRQMWNARSEVMKRVIDKSGGKPVRIIIKERGKDEDILPNRKTEGSKDNGIDKRNGNGGKSRGEIHKKDSDGEQHR